MKIAVNAMIARVAQSIANKSHSSCNQSVKRYRSLGLGVHTPCSVRAGPKSFCGVANLAACLHPEGSFAGAAGAAAKPPRFGAATETQFHYRFPNLPCIVWKMPDVPADTLGWIITALVAAVLVGIVAIAAFWLRR